MSRPFKAAQVVRCPLCHDAGAPAHVGLSVFLCEACGNHFRIVHATRGATGARLGALVADVAAFAKTGRNRGRP